MSRRGRQGHDNIEERDGFKFIRLGSGRIMSFWDAQGEADKSRTALGRHVSRMFKLAGEYDMEWVESFVDDLESYVAALREEIKRLREVRAKRDRIASLRNVEGRTPEEAAEFLRKASELERQLDAK